MNLNEKALDFRVQCQRRLEIIERQSQAIDTQTQRSDQQAQIIEPQNHALWVQNQTIENAITNSAALYHSHN